MVGKVTRKNLNERADSFKTARLLMITFIITSIISVSTNENFKMAVQLSNEQNKLIEKIANENAFKKFQVTINTGAEKGDNFLGIINTVTVKNRDKRLELILKSAHQSECFRKAAPLRQAYLREIYFYTNILQEFQKFQKENNVSDPFSSYAKVYGSSTLDGNECFVMENLKTIGYQLWNKKVSMNSEHITAVLKEYAKFHAISVALNHKHPEFFNELTENFTGSIWEEKGDPVKTMEKRETYINAVCSTAFKAVEDEPDLVEFLKKFKLDVSNFIATDFRAPEYTQVLIHGDCWCNNFLFKYENNNKAEPSSLKILDWQLSFLSSIGYDFCYFFLAHSSKEILNDYKTYMKIYYETFSKQLRNFNCDPDEVFPYSKFEKHVHKFMIFGFYMCLLILKIMLTDSEDAPDFEKMTEGAKNLLEGMDFKISNFDVFKKRITDILVFLKENNFVNQ